MDKKILVVAVIAVVIIAAAAAVLLGSGNGDKEDSKTGYTVTFDANGGSGTMAPVTGVSGTYTIPTTCDFTAPEGCYFLGWGITTAAAISGMTIDVKEDTTLYAIWDSQSYKGLTVVKSYRGDGITDSPVLTDMNIKIVSGSQTKQASFKDFASGIIKYEGKATMTITVNGGSDWTYETGKIVEDEKGSAGIFGFTYNGEKYKLYIEVTGAEFSGSADPATYTFSTDGTAYMLLLIDKLD